MYVDVPQTRQEFTKYLAEVNFMDQEFGNVLSILEQEKVADQSVVVIYKENECCLLPNGLVMMQAYIRHALSAGRE